MRVGTRNRRHERERVGVAGRTRIVPVSAISTMRPMYITATRSLTCPDHADVVRDEDHRESSRSLQIRRASSSTLSLHGHVESRDRLIGNDDRAPGDGAARCPRADAGYHLVRADSEMAKRRIEADGRRAVSPMRKRASGAACKDAVDVAGFATESPMVRLGVERGVRVLEHHPDAETHGGARPGPLAAIRSSVPRKATRPGFGPGQAHDGAADRGLAASGLADDAQNLAFAQREVDTVDRLHAHALAAATNVRTRCAAPSTVRIGRTSRSVSVGDRVQAQSAAWLAPSSMRAADVTIAQSGRASGQRGAKVQPVADTARPRCPAGDGAQARRADAADGHAAHEAARVGMSGCSEQGPRVGRLDDPARIHHGDAVGELGDDAHVVRDEQHRHRQAITEFARAGRESGTGR